MPYIKKQDRISIDYLVNELVSAIRLNGEEDRAGVLNYTFTKLLLGTSRNNNYREYNESVGVLECCKLELYRRVISKYEMKKRRINGEVY